MSSNSENLEQIVLLMLEKQPTITPDAIRRLVDQFRGTALTSLSDAEAEALVRKIEANSEVQMGVGTILHAKHQPWVAATRPSRDDFYWDRYRQLLARTMPAAVVNSMDRITDEILDALQDPTSEGIWDRRGMVVGHVQSGKTANYTGLISKAADSGYRIIIVIAGSHNNLREQTQLRIDSGFVGWNSAAKPGLSVDGWVGVGRISPVHRPITFTSVEKDFNKATATALGLNLAVLSEPAVFVIKKNASTLKSLNVWLRQHNASRGSQRIPTPMLLIDDEADNASINTSANPENATRINAGIRELLQLFERSCYVGYTATPFANIFIDPDTETAMLGDDLFPRDFIVSLDPPSNYVGANRVFIDEPERFLRIIDDNGALLPLKHSRDLAITELPESLRDALRTFVLVQATRLARGSHHQHNSMLINASRFNAVQRRITGIVKDEVNGIWESVRLHGARPWQDNVAEPEFAHLYAVWEREYADTLTDQTWETIYPHIREAVGPIEVQEVNQRSSSLDYGAYADTGRSVIAVGGLALSRGLTLEGLSVSYFLRNSQMYDTLMQMGRWFGYRPRYDDLCRIWMPDEAAGWYAHIAESIDLLRADLRKMTVAGGTPSDFGLKVRSHPDALAVTARNKMGRSEKIPVRIGLTMKLIETTTLRREPDALESNLAALQWFVVQLESLGLSPAEQVKWGLHLRRVPHELVTGFLHQFRNHPDSFATDSEPVCQYINERAADELGQWDVLFPTLLETSVRDDTMTRDLGNGLVIRVPYRSAGASSRENRLVVSDNGRVASRGVEEIGLEEPVKRQACEAYEQTPDFRVGKSGKPNYPDWIYREKRQHPLLILHLLDIRMNREVAKTRGIGLAGTIPPRIVDQPILAWSISFPGSETEEKRVTYVLNTQALRELHGSWNDRDEDDDASEA